MCDSIKDYFVTGKWTEGENAETLLKLDDLNDGDLYGDFEDLETGQKYNNEEGAPPKDSNNGLYKYNYVPYAGISFSHELNNLVSDFSLAKFTQHYFE